MLVFKPFRGPISYNSGGLFTVTIGELQKVEYLGSGFVGGVFTGSGIKAMVQANASSMLFPIVVNASGNVLGVQMLTVESGFVAVASTPMIRTPMVAIAEGY